jgi:sugar phosphate permease
LAVAGVVVGSLLFSTVKQYLGATILPLEFLVCGVTLLAMWRFQTVPVLVTLAFINMIACGMMLPTLVTNVAAGLPDALRGRGLGLWNSAFVLAQFLSSSIIAAVLATSGRTVLDAFAMLGALALVIAALLVKSRGSRVAAGF